MIPEEHYNYEKYGNLSYESTDSIKNMCFKKVEKFLLQLIYIKVKIHKLICYYIN